jgi:hypothetical protein
MNADFPFSPASNPSAMPAPKPMMFFNAPPSSTPMTSSLVYTRKELDIKIDWARSALERSSQAITVEEGFPCTIS